MGMSTVMVMTNDLTHRWPEDMRDAMRRFRNNGTAERFKTGSIVSISHASSRQIVSVQQDSGYQMSAISPVSQVDLDAMSEILRGHGYTVRQPGRARGGDGPLSWGGFAATQDKGDTT